MNNHWVIEILMDGESQGLLKWIQLNNTIVITRRVANAMSFATLEEAQAYMDGIPSKRVTFRVLDITKVNDNG
jgi:hypothetical protein